MQRIVYGSRMSFLCPIRSTVNFKEVVVPKGAGYYRTAFFECCNCSVMFRDPEKFSTGRDDKAKAVWAKKNQRGPSSAS